jgi:hypothetical protein
LRDLFKVLGRHLSQVFADDRSKLRQRLALREAGRCVVGFIPATELKKLLREKRVAMS